jgi:transposase
MTDNFGFAGSAAESPAERFTDQMQSGPLLPRLAWMMCYAETGNVQVVCDKFAISKKTFYKWLKRYQQANGNTISLLDRSRRPHHSPRATPDSNVRILLEARMATGYGQRRLKAFLEEKYKISLSERTIWKLLKTHGADFGTGE